jgi:hypothetical protein
LSKLEHKQQQQTGGSSNSDTNGNSGTALTADDYYRLSGVPKPSPMQAMGQKTVATSKAHAVAVKQYQLQRTEGLSERQSLEQVEELLEEQNVKERVVSRERAASIQQWQQQKQSRNKATSVAAAITSQSLQKADSTSKSQKMASSKETSSNNNSSTLPLIVNACTAPGIMSWSERSEAVPYEEWTIGASTAPDHWVAKNILDLSEETWQSLLEGQ